MHEPDKSMKSWPCRDALALVASPAQAKRPWFPAIWESTADAMQPHHDARESLNEDERQTRKQMQFHAVFSMVASFQSH
jgi:hypothetical protein